MRRARHLGETLCFISALALAGCGDDSNGGGGAGAGSASGDGTVTEQWAGYCTGTFTEDTPIPDAFGDIAFTARAGSEYLLSDFSDTFGERAEFLYLTDVGPSTFRVDPNDAGEWPFTSNCAIGEGIPYSGVFDDVSVFADEELTTKICDLSEGSVLRAAAGSGYGFSSSSGASAIYEVILGPFSAECEGHGLGYVLVPRTTIFGTTTWLVPIAQLIGSE